MPFQQMQYQPLPQLPEAPTANGYQVAGAALQQGGQMIGEYGKVFNNMVQERQRAIIEAQQRAVEEKKNQIFFDSVAKKEQQEQEAETKKKSYFDDIQKIPSDAADRKDQLDRAYQKYTGSNPEEYHKQNVGPYEKEEDYLKGNQEWDRRLGILHSNDMEKLGARLSKSGASSKPSFAGYTGIARIKLEQAARNPSKIPEIKKETTERIRRLTNDVAVFEEYLGRHKDFPSEEEALRINKVKVKIASQKNDLKQWQSLDSALQEPATFEQDYSVTTNNGTSIPPEIGQAIDWLRQNPDHESTEGVRKRLMEEGYLK